MLIFGGSLGADRINDTVIGMLDRISKDNKIELLFGTGDRNYDKIMNKIPDIKIPAKACCQLYPIIKTTV